VTQPLQQASAFALRRLGLRYATPAQDGGPGESLYYIPIHPRYVVHALACSLPGDSVSGKVSGGSSRVRFITFAAVWSEAGKAKRIVFTQAESGGWHLVACAARQYGVEPTWAAVMRGVRRRGLFLQPSTSLLLWLKRVHVFEQHLRDACSQEWVY
jgi:hypothetical protein